MKNINLIRNVAWTFAKKTNLDFEDLFGEAALAYCEALETFNADKGNKLATYAYCCMRNHLINVCKKEYHRQCKTDLHDTFPEQIHPTTNEETDFWDSVDHWPEHCLAVVEMILNNPEQFLLASPNYRRQYKSTPVKSRKRVEEKLDEKGWLEFDIRDTLKEIETLLQTV